MRAAPASPARTGFFAIGVCILLLLPNSSQSATTFGEIMDWCSNRGDDGDQRLCVAYVGAGLELLRSPDPVSNGGHRVCAPNSDLNTIIIPMLTTWMKQNPQARDQEALPTAAAVLAGRYPCS
jgi:hypothetical protein